MTREEKNAYQREWNKRNRDKKRAHDKKYRESHRKEINETHKAWRDNNKEHLREQAKANYSKNPQAHKERVNKYRASHQEQVKEANRKYREANRQKRTDYERIKRQADPVYRFRTSFRNLIYKYLRKKGYTGDKTVWEVVGCTFEEFLIYVQNQFEDDMTLENYGHDAGCWNIDHIVPICTAVTNEDLERLNHYSNLRPMWASDNYKRPRKML